VGNAEKLIGRVIADMRDRVFLVLKVWPSYVADNGMSGLAMVALPVPGPIISIIYLFHWPKK
jgi:hypothetical protein